MLSLQKKFFQKLKSLLYDLLFCRPEHVLKQSIQSHSICLKNFSVSIPHYRRANQIHRPLLNLLNEPAVREVIVFDDGSPETEFYSLEKNITLFNKNGKIQLFRREENRRALATKLDAIRKAKADWVLILDSDNTAFRSFFNAFTNTQNLNPSVIYAAPEAFPYFSFRPFAGMELNFQSCASNIASGILRKSSLLNDGNYFVHRETFLKVIEPLYDLAQSIGPGRDCADVLVVNYLWLSSEKILKILPKGAYHHRIEKSSFWLSEAEISRRRVIEIFNLWAKGHSWDSSIDNLLKTSF